MDQEEELERTEESGTDGGGPQTDSPQGADGPEGKTEPERAPAGEAPERPEAGAMESNAEEDAAARRRYDQVLAGLGLRDPKTGAPVDNAQELKNWGERYRQEQLAAAAKEQGRSVKELAEEQETRLILDSLRQREEARRKEVQDRRDFMVQDLAEFLRQYPDADVEQVEHNPQFLKFAGKRLYHEPLAQLYGDFVELMTGAERSAAAKAEEKRRRGTGGGRGKGDSGLTPAQTAELEAWNKAYPELRMSKSEFLKYGGGSRGV